jgi:hypothetical protein
MVATSSQTILQEIQISCNHATMRAYCSWFNIHQQNWWIVAEHLWKAHHTEPFQCNFLAKKNLGPGLPDWS